MWPERRFPASPISSLGWQCCPPSPLVSVTKRLKPARTKPAMPSGPASYAPHSQLPAELPLVLKISVPVGAGRWPQPLALEGEACVWPTPAKLLGTAAAPLEVGVAVVAAKNACAYRSTLQHLTLTHSLIDHHCYRCCGATTTAGLSLRPRVRSSHALAPACPHRSCCNVAALELRDRSTLSCLFNFLGYCATPLSFLSLTARP